ncbi:hypothetical protein EDM59_16430 [Brevibacillus nitrificans]|uniref:Uncharacterized protein n=1 Tax=Brevibacillus nitrificans TaxID=651560 RepID=A0A3M8D7U9_9BACL|nr:hypothetical protein EDM59_16430 [Brevibacillus nitrificans]
MWLPRGRRIFPFFAPGSVLLGVSLVAAQRLAGKRKRGSRFAVFTGCVSFARQPSLRWAGLHSRSAWKNSSLALPFFDSLGLGAS